VKRVSDIFNDPKFYVNRPTPNDFRQGRIGDGGLVAALGALGNKPGLIEKVCIARDEEIGVYGFFFFRDGEWRPEVIDDKLYLKHPDFDRTKSGVPGNPERNKQRQITEEENYRKMSQVLLDSFTNKCNVNLSSALQRPSISQAYSRTTNHTLNHISYWFTSADLFLEWTIRRQAILSLTRQC
jgi:hypothetical protein